VRPTWSLSCPEKNSAINPQEKQAGAEAEALAEKLESTGIIFEIGNSKLDKVYLNKDTYFDNVQFSGRRDNQGWQAVKLSGHNRLVDNKDDASTEAAATEKLKSGQFRIIYGPSANGQYPLHIEAQDLGSLLSAVKGKNIMKGGYLVLNGASQGPFLTQPIQATAQLDSFTVQEAPGIAKILNMASLTQVVSSLMHTGLAFNSASGDLGLDGTRLSTQQFRLEGGSLGLRVSGWVDLKQLSVDLSGTVIPWNKINTIVGIVPVLGQVMTGQDGKGLMAIDYTLKGTLTKPEVAIKKAPLTPGILKNTLGTDKGQTPGNQQ